MVVQAFFFRAEALSRDSNVDSAWFETRVGHRGEKIATPLFVRAKV